MQLEQGIFQTSSAIGKMGAGRVVHQALAPPVHFHQDMNLIPPSSRSIIFLNVGRFLKS